MQLNSLDNLWHRGWGSIPAIDEWWSKVEDEIGEQWTSILTEKHLHVQWTVKRLILTIRIQNSDKLNHEIIKGTVWVGLCMKAFALGPHNANAPRWRYSITISRIMTTQDRSYQKGSQIWKHPIMLLSPKLVKVWKDVRTSHSVPKSG